MQTLALTITLTSDAEPGSGIGAVGLNQFLPRDHNQRPMLQASHLKGLMLDALQQIRRDRGWSDTLDAAVFGAPGVTPSRVHLSDARSGADVPVLMVSRTAVDGEGSKRDKSLRRVEALPCGHTLIASVRIDTDPGTTVDLAARLAALSIPAIGGNRNRGSGACLVTIDGESRTPGALLKLIETALKHGYPKLGGIEARASAKTLSTTAPPVLRRLIFVADGPICCPERPVAPGNTIESGLAIPASAIQGALLTRLNAVDGPLASACFEDSSFRAWPLLPAAIRTDELDGQDGLTIAANLFMASHVPMTHRISKLTLPDGRHVLGDKAIETPLPDNSPSPGSPLRSCNGVLLADGSGDVKLWRARDIPRMLSTHAVHRDPDGNRNLFSVLSLAPLVFSGLVSLPHEAAAKLDKCLAEDNHISIGKARSVRGGGRLYMLPFKVGDPREPVALPTSRTGCVFVVQSPLAIPDDWDVGRAVDVLARLVADAGWRDMDTDASYAECGLRFGWNRYGLGASVGNQGRLRARRCILPGSVVVLKTPIANPKDKLLAGIGEGREAGFGALLPHPGIATAPASVPTTVQVRCSDGSGKLAYDLWTSARGSKGPSASQISALLGQFNPENRQTAITYLDRQKQERPARVWQRWEPVYAHLREAIETRDPKVVTAALNGWKDLAATHKEERR